MPSTSHAAPSEVAESPPITQVSTPRPKRATRAEAAGTVLDFAAAQRARGTSQRAFAAAAEVPRTTLQGWIARGAHTGVPPEAVAFFESPAGIACLHRIYWALVFVVVEVLGGSVRQVALVLRLACLDRWLAPSHGSLHASAVQLDTAVGAWGDAQRAQHGATMPRRRIALVEDETFHPAICLVALEPDSDFILVEEYAAHRDAATWDAVVTAGTRGLAVDIEQVTADLAKGIGAHVRAGLHAHPNADIFHVQYDASGATGAALAARERRAAEGVTKAEAAAAAVRAAAQRAGAVPRGPGRPVNWAGRVARAAAAVATARDGLAAATADRTASQEDVRALSVAYHPFDLTTGVRRTAAQVGAELRAIFARLTARAERLALGVQRLARLAKAARVVPTLEGTIAWVHRQIETRVASLALPPAVAAAVHDLLIPGRYLVRVAPRARDAATRASRRAQGRALIAAATDGVLRDLAVTARHAIETVATACAALFVAASSPVEGRNGRLRLFQAHAHHVPPRRLKAFTTVHNFFTTRPDGTTPGERFFGSPHDDLFEHLCQILPLPPRPRLRREPRARGPDD